MPSRTVKLARHGARIGLHGIARPILKYPPLEDSHWHLPNVLRWEAYTPPDGAPRNLRKLKGLLIVPSLVDFLCPPGVHISNADRVHFSTQLRLRTLSRWEIDYEGQLWRNVVRAERLSQELKYTVPSDGGLTTHTLALPAPSNPPRVGVLRGLFMDGWSRADRHTTADGTADVDMPALPEGVHESEGL